MTKKIQFNRTTFGSMADIFSSFLKSRLGFLLKYIKQILGFSFSENNKKESLTIAENKNEIYHSPAACKEISTAFLYHPFDH